MSDWQPAPASASISLRRHNLWKWNHHAVVACLAPAGRAQPGYIATHQPSCQCRNVQKVCCMPACVYKVRASRRVNVVFSTGDPFHMILGFPFCLTACIGRRDQRPTSACDAYSVQSHRRTAASHTLSRPLTHVRTFPRSLLFILI